MSDDPGDQGRRPAAAPAPYRGSAPRQGGAGRPGPERPPGEVSTSTDDLEVTVTVPAGAPGSQAPVVPDLGDLRVDRLEVTPAPRPAPAVPGYAGSDPVGRSTLLVVGVDYAPDPSLPGGQTTRLARNLAGVAQRVLMFTGVTGDPNSFPSSLEPKIDRHNRRSYGQDGGVHVVRHRHHVAGRAPGGKVREQFGFAKAVLGTPIRHVPDLVIGVTPGPGAAVAASRLARRYGTPLIMVVEHPEPTPRRSGPLSSLLSWRESEALRRANRVVVADPELRPGVLARGVAPDRVDHLTGGAWTAPEPHDLAPREEPAAGFRSTGLGRAAARQQLGWPVDGFVAVYAGNIGFTQDVATVIRAAQVLAPRGAEIRFAVVGDGSRRALMEQAATDLPAVRFMDPVTAAEYPALIAAADALILTEVPGQPDRSLVGKLRTYLVSGRPVIAAVNPDGATGRMVRNSEEPVVSVPAGDAEAMAAALARLHDENPGSGTTQAQPRVPRADPAAPAGEADAAGPDDLGAGEQRTTDRDPAGEAQRIHDIARSLLLRGAVRESLRQL